MEIWVIGHRNPDTDAIISAIAFSELLRKIGYDAIPCRIGDLSPETSEILKKCSLSPPRLIDDVRIRAKDVMSQKVFYVKEGEAVKRAIDLILEHSIRSIPVVNDEMRVVGLFSVESFAKFFMSEISRKRLILDAFSLKRFIEISGGKIANSAEIKDGGKVFVGAWSLQKIENYSSLIKGNILITGDRELLHLKAIDTGVSSIIVTGGYLPSEGVRKKAEEKGIPIIISPHDTYTTLRLLDLSQPVEKFSEEALMVHEEDLVSEVREKMLSLGTRTSVVVDDEEKLKGIITRSDLMRDLRRKVALVDHNEFSQSVEGIEDSQIVAVVDHHRISGDIKTHSPIIFRVEPLGATSTLIYKISSERGVDLSEKILEAILYAILTDTLLLKSPTCTEEDKRISEEICRILGIKLSDAMDFVRYCMSLNEPKSPREMIRKDYKEFHAKNLKFGISQMFTARPEKYLEPEELRKIKEELENFVESRGLDFAVLMITDYLNEVSYLICSGRAEILREALGIDPEAEYSELKGVTSRKAQVLPRILSAIERSF